MNTPNQTKKGFTIIEVVLVLAIAGLIFLMVFIALPALQRNQRDTQRRQDVSRVVTQVNNFQTNNNGNVPTGNKVNTFVNNYLKKDEFKDPKTGDEYVISDSAQDSALDTKTIQFLPTYKCDGESVEGSAGSRSVAVRIELEGSGIYCQDNQ